jgi:hypothetical protein
MQVIWLADASDADVWRAIDSMQRTKQAAFVFVPDGNPGDMSLIPWSLAGTSNALDCYRRALGSKNGNFVAKAYELINSKTVEEGAQSVISGISLKVARINLLLTKRLKNALAAHGVPALGGSACRGY